MIECEAITGPQLKKRSKKQISVELGWDIISGQKVINSHEQKIIKQILSWRAKGLSFYKIALKLNSKGITGKRGGPWD